MARWNDVVQGDPAAKKCSTFAESRRMKIKLDDRVP